ncbi:hypothetical protein DdX_18743 [Ditylenchus destructor]|uniref:Uncharacterized protein n=1 Tax=Ditylenchus destructor TaxID=166010 RepID=A0AAD4QUM8_9BILA|nr:hypothetical protein DdX_18743 [Ditylenchus destructor]
MGRIQTCNISPILEESKKKSILATIPNIAAMDNGTMVEAFKFLNYYQLAKNSLVSKRYWNLIRTHRHKLALLDVNYIDMKFLGLKNRDEYQVVESTRGYVKGREVVEALKRNCANSLQKKNYLKRATTQDKSLNLSITISRRN